MPCGRATASAWGYAFGGGGSGARTIEAGARCGPSRVSRDSGAGFIRAVAPAAISVTAQLIMAEQHWDGTGRSAGDE
jgi:hypothetical protein